MQILSFTSFIALAVTLAQASDLHHAHAGIGRFERRARHADLEQRAPISRRATAHKTTVVRASTKQQSNSNAAKEAAAKEAAAKAAAAKAKAAKAPAPAAKAPAPAAKAPAPAAKAPAPAANGNAANVWSGKSSFTQQGSTGVSGMQLTVVDNHSVVLLDKSEHNPLKVAGHPAWGQWMNLATGQSTALNLLTNSFCGGGAWLSNGTLVSFGGNPTTSTTAFDDGNGLQAIRIFPQCNDNGCYVYENPSRIRLTSPRWYGSGARLADGSLFIAGGMTAGGFNNVAATDNPTYEFFPPKSLNNGNAIYSPFLHQALNSNLFPIMYLLPNGQIFMAANKMAQLYNWQGNAESRLPGLPMRVTYPWSAASTLLPLTPGNNYTPTMLFCGGSNQNDAAPVYGMSSQAPTVATCARMDITSAGIAKGWDTSDSLPEGRTMGEAVILPDGNIFILNGAHTGFAGYGNVHNAIGASNADNPVLRPILYSPNAPAGRRVNSNFPSASVPRMYHSAASLLPDGRVMIVGSNPNADVSNVNYHTEYRIEYFNPPYMSMTRPAYTGLPSVIGYNAPFTLQVSLPAGTTASQVSVSLMDLGYHTHGVAMDMRMVQLVVQSLQGNTLTVVGPPNSNIFPPGIGFLYVLAQDVPSVGQKVLIGGNQPPVDHAALANMLDNTAAITRIAALAAGKLTDTSSQKRPDVWDPDHPVHLDEGTG